MFKSSGFFSAKVKLLLILLLLLLAAGCQTKVSKKLPVPKYRQVQFKTDDGLVLVGKLYGKGKTGVILSHMYPADQESWRPLALFLSQRGYKVLTYNFRGYLPSQGERQIALLDKDLLTAIKFMRPQVEKLFLVGASMGGTASLKVLNKVKVNGVVTISAPPEFQGLAVGEKWAQTIVPKLFLATNNDGQAAFFARQFYRQAYEPKELEIYPGSAHGTNLFYTSLKQKLFRRLDNFMKKFNHYEP